jgi:glycosyltransferase involved in cell wall biosynthesis
MRAAIDATPLILSSGGLHRYTSELSRALAENFPHDEFILISDQKFTGVADLAQGGAPRNGLERRWWLWGVQCELSRQHATLFHGTDFSVPYLPLRPSVLTLHDLSPWMRPEWHHCAARVRQRTPLLIRLGIATMILTPSEAVRKQAMEWFSIPATRIAAVPLAASSHFRPIETAPGGDPYFLFVGTLEPRKNIPTLVAAWREVRKHHAIDLVLAGRRRADFGDMPPEPGLRITGEVAEENLPRLYSGAVAVVYPSWYEGFGLPVLEAMQCGACVIASSDPAISELASGAAALVAAGDVRALTQAMTAAATLPDWRTALREKALRQAQGFSWARTARLTREVYAEAERRFRY